MLSAEGATSTGRESDGVADGTWSASKGFWIVGRHSFLERVLQSELDLAVVRSSVGDRGATWHVDGNLRTTTR